MDIVAVASAFPGRLFRDRVSVGRRRGRTTSGFFMSAGGRAAGGGGAYNLTILNPWAWRYYQLFVCARILLGSTTNRCTTILNRVNHNAEFSFWICVWACPDRGYPKTWTQPQTKLVLRQNHSRRCEVCKRQAAKPAGKVVPYVELAEPEDTKHQPFVQPSGSVRD